MNEMPGLYDSLNLKNARRKEPLELSERVREADEHLNVVEPGMLMYQEYVGKKREVMVNVLADTGASTKYIGDHIVRRLPGVKRVVDPKRVKLPNKRFLISPAR
ncbi:hypothetical protein AJ78_09049, partial [Emergomyces pasteurianus Ep9510]